VWNPRKLYANVHSQIKSKVRSTMLSLRSQIDTLRKTASGWIFEDAIFVALEVEIDPTKAVRAMPLGLRPADRATLFVAHYPRTSFGSVYSEAGLFVHLRFPRGAVHCPWMLVDDDVALITGRELLGYPTVSGVAWVCDLLCCSKRPSAAQARDRCAGALTRTMRCEPGRLATAAAIAATWAVGIRSGISGAAFAAAMCLADMAARNLSSSCRTSTWKMQQSYSTGSGKTSVRYSTPPNPGATSSLPPSAPG